MRNRLLGMILALCLAFCAVGCGTAKPDGVDSSAVLSPALDLLRGQTQLVRCTVWQQDLAFSEADFCGLTGANTEYIVINSLPDISAGLLLLNGSAVIAGQTIPVSSLNYLKFVPGKPTGESTTAEAKFTFTAKAAGWETRELDCVIALLDSENYPPVASDQRTETFASVACFTELSATDPNGDAVLYTITSYPRHGTLRLEGNTAVYLPLDDYTGEDAFSYVAKDRYGATSAQGTVTFEVMENRSGIYFADLEGTALQNTAIRLCADEVMTYRKENGSFYFDPDGAVSKLDCLIMMMCLCGEAEAVCAVAETDAADDAGLSAGKKGFLQRAISLGAVHLEDGKFDPLAPVTAADAAYMATALLGMPALSAKQEFADLEATPVWACVALVSADSSGILSAKDGALGAKTKLTRADVAELLDNMRRYGEQKA